MNAMHPMPRVSESLPVDPGERLLLSVFRYIGAAYETGDAACWDAAHNAAEAAEGVFDGALLVARASTLMRLLRRGPRDITLLPPLSRWLSSDEGSLMTLVRRADHGPEAVGWARRFDETAQGAARLVVAARALPRCAGAGPRSGSPRLS